MAAELHLAINDDAVTDGDFSAFETAYSTVTFKRCGVLSPFWLRNPADPTFASFHNGNSITYPEPLRAWFQEHSGHLPGQTNEISLDILSAAVNSVITYAHPPFDDSPLNLDFEPPAYTYDPFNATVSLGDQQAIAEFWFAIQQFVAGAKPDLTDVGFYGMWPGAWGRPYATNAAATRMIPYGYATFGEAGFDDTPLFGERNFYPSDRVWGVLKVGSDEAAVFVRDNMHMPEIGVGHFVGYPNGSMIEPDDPRLVGTVAEGITGGLDLWKTYIDYGLEQMRAAGVQSRVWLRRFFVISNLQNYTTIGEDRDFPLDETYWRGMVAYIAKRVQAVVIYAGGDIGTGSLDTVLANGVTLRDLIEWAAEEIRDAADDEFGGQEGSTTLTVANRSISVNSHLITQNWAEGVTQYPRFTSLLIDEGGVGERSVEIQFVDAYLASEITVSTIPPSPPNQPFTEVGGSWYFVSGNIYAGETVKLVSDVSVGLFVEDDPGTEYSGAVVAGTMLTNNATDTGMSGSASGTAVVSGDLEVIGVQSTGTAIGVATLSGPAPTLMLGMSGSASSSASVSGDLTNIGDLGASVDLAVSVRPYVTIGTVTVRTVA